MSGKPPATTEFAFTRPGSPNVVIEIAEVDTGKLLAVEVVPRKVYFKTSDSPPHTPQKNTRH